MLSPVGTNDAVAQGMNALASESPGPWMHTDYRLLSFGGSAMHDSWTTVLGPPIQNVSKGFTPPAPTGQPGCPCGDGYPNQNPPQLTVNATTGAPDKKAWPDGVRMNPNPCAGTACQTYWTLEGCSKLGGGLADASTPPSQIDPTTCTDGYLQGVIANALARDKTSADFNGTKGCGQLLSQSTGKCSATPGGQPVPQFPGQPTVTCDMITDESICGSPSYGASCTWTRGKGELLTGTGSNFGLASIYDQECAWTSCPDTGNCDYNALLACPLKGCAQAPCGGTPDPTGQQPWVGPQKWDERIVYTKSGNTSQLMCLRGGAGGDGADYLKSTTTITVPDPASTTPGAKKTVALFDPVKTAWTLITLLRSIGMNGIDWDLEGVWPRERGLQSNLQMLITAMDALTAEGGELYVPDQPVPQRHDGIDRCHFPTRLGHSNQPSRKAARRRPSRRPGAAGSLASAERR